MTQKSAETGPGAMGLVAIEQKKFPPTQRIISDDLAYRILPFGMRAAILIKAGPFSGEFIVSQAEKKVPGLWGSIMCRKRYIDDKVSEAVLKGEIEAAVNLGAGYDTRTFRLPALDGIPIFEVDQKVTIRKKGSRIEKLFGTVPENITLVAIDFDREHPGKLLRSRGWKGDAITFFILEGVSQYLDETGVRSTFECLSEAVPGSRLVFTYVREDFLKGENLYGLDFLYHKMVAKDGIWIFGMDPGHVDDFLREYGWSVLEHLGYDELAGRYVAPTGRDLESMPIERIVYAQKV
jgi:methyltransferase (TIGR00027 family)